MANPEPAAARPRAPRRTRPEMRADSRARLLDSAVDLIVEGGVSRASIRGICERAGFSQGAFYSYFGSKDDILFTLVEEHMGALARSFEAIIAASPVATLDAKLDAITTSLDTLSSQPERSVLVIELHLHARRDAAFRSRFEPVRRAYESAFTNVTEHLLRSVGLTANMPSDHIARILLALWSGSTLQAHNPAEISHQVRDVFAALAHMQADDRNEDR
ncbi:TetR/AcrR family transcriptional regulator [Sphingomonas hankookensis]